jgi:outer membrane protein assembly factor BamB
VRTQFQCIVQRISGCLLIAASLLLLAACSGNDRAHKPSELTPITNKFDLAPVWTLNVGGSEPFNFHPVVVGEAVYASSNNGSLYKIELQTGRTLWKVSVPEDLSVGPGSDGQTTVVVSTKGTVYAYDQSGTPIWNLNIGSEVLTEPIVASGVVVIRTLDSRFIGLDALTGARRWNYQRQQSTLSLRVGYGMLPINNEVIVTGFTGGRFGMIAIANGGLIWETPVSFPKGFSEIERLNDVTARPSLDGEALCAVSYQGRIGCGVARTGALMWFKEFSSYTGTAQSAEMVFSANEKSQISAFATRDGSLIWESNKLMYRNVGEPLAIGRAVFMGDADGYVHALSQSNGELLARIRHDSSPISAAPIAASGLILIQSQGGKLAAYSPK